MAGLGKKTFVQGTTLNASDVNGYLMEQSVMKFASAAARTTAIPSPSEAMVTYLDDTNLLYVYDGSGWVSFSPSGVAGSGAWNAFTPSLTNMTIGNGTLACYWIQIGKTIHARGRLTWGSTTSVAGAISIGLPATASSNGSFTGSLTMRAGGVDYLGYIAPTTTTIAVSAVGSAGTYANRVTTSATIPGTWTSADNITFSITYEAA